MPNDRMCDVVVDAGNAALTAALSALEQGAYLLVLERPPEYLRGCLSCFSGGLLYKAYPGGSGLMAGAVFDNVEGAGAAQCALAK